MKQLRWVWVLGIAAVILFGVFIFVDRQAKQEEARAQIGAAKQLLSIDSTTVTRITIDNEEGHFAFDWSTEAGSWLLVSSEQFNLNTYTVSAVCNYICNLSSLKTIAFDCKDTAVYGFDDPVTLKVYTTETGSENPYILYVGDNTPTYDAYYAMVGGSDDVYTIDYTSGSIFCVAKETLKNSFLFDTYSSLVEYFKLEADGKTVMELKRDDARAWQLQAPSGFNLNKSRVDEMMELLVRATVVSFIEENPSDLAQYGLDQPAQKVYVKGVINEQNVEQEIWFGNYISDREDEYTLYAYFANSKEVFTVLRGDVSFIHDSLDYYLLPYCIDINIEDLQALEIDMGEIYDMHVKMDIDYENNQYTLNDIDIDALEDETILGLYQDYYRSISNLRFTELELDAKPDTDAEPVITILYTRKDGTQTELEFIEKAENNYYLLHDHSYTGMTVRLNSFTATASVINNYELLQKALQ